MWQITAHKNPLIYYCSGPGRKKRLILSGRPGHCVVRILRLFWWWGISVAHKQAKQAAELRKKKKKKTKMTTKTRWMDDDCCTRGPNYFVVIMYLPKMYRKRYNIGISANTVYSPCCNLQNVNTIHSSHLFTALPPDSFDHFLTWDYDT